MAISRDPRHLAAALGAGLALSLPAAAPSQTTPSAAGISSGRGAGIGTGGSGTGSPRPGTSSALPPGGTRRTTRPGAATAPGTLSSPDTLARSQPGSVRGPMETASDPETERPAEGPEANEERLKQLDARLLDEARAIAQPEEKALALARVARSKVTGQDYATAWTALVEAGQAAQEVAPGIVRDLRIMAVVSGLIYLAEAQSSEGRAGDAFGEPDEPLPGQSPADRLGAMKAAHEAWGLAANLSARIGRRSYRSQTLYQVVESYSGEISRQAVLLDNQDEQAPALHELVDTGLTRAAAHAERIDLLLWRDRAVSAVVTGAAGARRFDRGLQIARSIPRPEARFDALLRLSEAQARHGTPEGTTRSYTEALQTVASISVTDLRTILTSVLIDSLISTGRFADARAATVLYPDAGRRVEALGAVAESQGRRGLSEPAKAWIAQEPSPVVRAQLYRRLNDGILTSLEQYRTNIYSISPTP